MPSARAAPGSSKTGPARLEKPAHHASSALASSSGPLCTTTRNATLPSTSMNEAIPTAATASLRPLQKGIIPGVTGSPGPHGSYYNGVASKHQPSVEDLIMLRKRIIALRADYLELYWDFMQGHDEGHVNVKAFAKVGLSDACLELRLLHRKIAMIMNELEDENSSAAKSSEKAVSKSKLNKERNMIKDGIEKYHQASQEYEDYRRRVLMLREALASIEENRIKLALCCSEMDALDQGVDIEPYPFEEGRLRAKRLIAGKLISQKIVGPHQSNNPYKKTYPDKKRRRDSYDDSEEADVPPRFMDDASRKKPRIILRMPPHSRTRATQPLSRLAMENSMQLASRDGPASSASPTGGICRKPRIILHMSAAAQPEPDVSDSQRVEQNDEIETSAAPDREVAMAMKPNSRLAVKATKTLSQASPLMVLKKLIDDLTDEAGVED